jgi:hypothetical protein
MKGQKTGECATCEGPIHFYPTLDVEGEPVLSADGTVGGAWAHTRTSDWITNAHQPVPKAEPV